MISLGQPTEWEKIFINDMTNKELISNTYIYVCVHIHTHIYIYLIQLNIKKKKKPWFNGHRIIRISFISRL